MGLRGLHAALMELRATPISLWRHDVLTLLSRAAQADGLRRAAADVEDEDAELARRAERPQYVLETRLGRLHAAALDGQRGSNAAMIADSVVALRKDIASRSPGPERAEYEAELAEAIAVGRTATAPTLAIAGLDSVVRYFAPVGNPIKLIPALVDHARAALALARDSVAAADLDSVAALYGRRGEAIASGTEREALLSQARAVLGQLAMLRLHEGQVREALAAIDRGRLPLRARGSGVVVEYAVIGDTVLAWTMDAAGIRLHRAAISRDSLRVTVERARAGLELGANGGDTRRALASLDEWLVRPIASRLGAPGTLVTIIPDRTLGGVPFAALLDWRRGRYLVEDHPIRYATTLAAAAEPRRGLTPPTSVLVVGAAARDLAGFDDLLPLPDAEREAQLVARDYPRAIQLLGPAADSAELMSRLSRVEVFHFAGHAVVDEQRPERSLLVVPPRGISPAAIERARLDHLRLVVLSACETARAQDESGNASGTLADAFLRAGAGGVLGSLWHVDDRSTTALMVAFHGAYRASGDAAEALRAAQLDLLRSPDATLRSPAVWAAFTYQGS